MQTVTTGPRLTIGYCRVSTEEQAEEGFSIEAQADRIRMYAELKGLGSVTIITDPGFSAKNLVRPGIQQCIAAIEADHVGDLVVWRVDRASRSTKDLQWLADLLMSRGVTFHSISESLDLSTASGRMFYGLLGTFAQFQREQLAENVKLGNERAVKEGRYINRPKLGYSLRDGLLVPNDDAVRVREIFRLRAEHMSYRAIEERTGVPYGTVMTVLESRVYLGEQPHRGGYVPGRHEPIVTEEQWESANSLRRRGRNTSADPLSSHVFCGRCRLKMSVQQNGKGQRSFQCRSRGRGCGMPARSNRGLARAAVLGLQLLASDEGLKGAIRRRLAGDARADARPHGRHRRSEAGSLQELSAKRAKLLELYYEDKISKDGFQEAEQDLLTKIDAAGAQAREEARQQRTGTEAVARFEQLMGTLSTIDFERSWEHGTAQQRRILVDELLESVTVFEDHLVVKVVHALPLKVLLSEVGLKHSESVGVGGPV